MRFSMERDRWVTSSTNIHSLEKEIWAAPIATPEKSKFHGDRPTTNIQEIKIRK
jgi:hypothetical protein